MKGQEENISKGCSGVWLLRPWQLAGCCVLEVTLLLPLPRQSSGVGDKDNRPDLPQVFR